MKRHLAALTLILLVFIIALVFHFSSITPFTVKIDTSLKGDPMTISAPGQGVYQVGVIMDPRRRTDQFVEDEVIFKPKDETEKASFIEKWEGVIISDGSIPKPLEKFAHLQRKIPESSGYHRIRVNTSSVNTEEIINHGAQLGLEGEYTFSSPAMLQLFGVILDARANDIPGVDLNGVFKPDCTATSTQEHVEDPTAPNPTLPNDGYMDAFDITNYNDPDISVTRAWQLTELFGVSPGTVPLCVIDSGFIITDDFSTFLSYDFVDGDYDVNADEGDYHGTRTLSVASARLDDQFGSAGTGGPVALPMPFRTDYSFYQGAEAIRTAISWGAEVINQSYGGYCNWVCEAFSGRALNEALDEAFNNGVVTVASAGNDEEDLDDELYYLPAEGGSAGMGNIVVGALDLATKRAIRNTTHRFGSNFGSALDTWVAVWPRISSTPTPTRDPDKSDIGRTSGASAYTSGTITLMKALSPPLTVSEVHDMVELSNVPSPDARVSSGYLNVFDAVQRAASHTGAIDPLPDSLEPNDHWNSQQIDSGEYCANLYDGDTEDGYWFWVDDIRPVQVEANWLLLGGYRTTLRGFGLGPYVSLPFNGELVPGSYFVRFRNASSTATFYEFSLDIGAPVAMTPDRFEINDTLSTSAELNLPGNQIGRTWTVDNINFHVSGDPDYFELILPSLPSLQYNDRVTIWIEPDENGYSSNFNLFMYDETGASLPVTGGATISIENISAEFPNRRIRFLVEDRMGRRNFYRILIDYEQYIIRPSPVPPPSSGFLIPAWLPDSSDLHLIQTPGSILEGLPIDYPFPNDPKIAKDIAKGNSPKIIPYEMMVLKWPKKNDFAMQITYPGKSWDMGFTLIDQKGNTLSEAHDVEYPKDKSTNNTTLVHKRMEFKGMARGIYGIKVNGTRYPILYSVKLDAVKAASH